MIMKNIIIRILKRKKKLRKYIKRTKNVPLTQGVSVKQRVKVCYNTKLL